jgi:ABC-type hemin transport system substrate-binding protein
MPQTVVDDLGRAIHLAQPPRRIVSLVPSLTELVWSLGAGSRLVGVTRYCTEPAALVAPLPKIGGTKNPQVAAIVALQPDLVLANSEENRREEFEQLLAAGLCLYVSFPTTVAAAADGIERLAAVLGVAAPGQALAGAIRAGLASLGPQPAKRVRVFCPIWRKPWMSIGGDTFAGDLLQYCGGENVSAGWPSRYPVVSLDEIARESPEVILLPDEPYPFQARHRALLGGLADTPAGRTGRIYLVDGKALSWYGPRTPAALRYFHRILRDARRGA